MEKISVIFIIFLYVGKILMCTLMRDIDWSVFSGIFFACFWCQNNTGLIKWVLKFYSGQEFCGGKVFIKNSIYLLNMEIFRFSISFKASYGHCFFSQRIHFFCVINVIGIQLFIIFSFHINKIAITITLWFISSIFSWVWFISFIEFSKNLLSGYIFLFNFLLF